MDTWEILNGVYEPLQRRVHDLGGRLASAGYRFQWNWYNNHCSKRGGAYQVEHFPVPVITVERMCDIILELDSVCIDAHLDCEQARLFDWKEIPWSFEVYGTEDYTEDLYCKGMSLEELPERIARCGGEIGLALTLPKDCRDEEILAIAAACKNWNTHVI